MPNRHHDARWQAVSVLLLSASLIGLAGCGAGGFSQDALDESPGAESFLNRIQTNCGKLSVGNQPIGWLLSASSNDTTFVDATSKLQSGQFSQSDYASYINSFYPTGANQPALDCIFNQL